jgi:ribose 5-phosphate isomerase A
VSASFGEGPIGLREMKRNAACMALDFVEAGSVIGIGSGTTVWSFIDVLAESSIEIAGAIPASLECARRLREIGVEVLGLSDCRPALYVDGADEIDMSGRAIKGGGAAHTQEKAIAMACDYWACIVDASKVVRELGGVPVPLEVAEGKMAEVLSAVERLGGEGKLRDGVLTDTGHQVIDAFGLPLADPLDLEASLDEVPGVIGNGVFARRTADVILVGRATGGVARIIPHRDDEQDA